MNRQGQSQQRPPTMGPTPLVNQLRPPYPYGGGGMGPPRNVNILQSGGYVPGMQPANQQRGPSAQQQTPSNLLPSPGTPFMQQQQQRPQSSFPFGGGALGGQQQQSSLPSQQPPNGNGPPPSASSASDAGLDPNDFPALGSTSASNNQNSSANGSLGGGSYASQAGGLGTGSGGLGGTPVGGGSGGGSSSTGAVNQQRDFTPDDFPALGGQQSQQSQDSHAHLNGFSDRQGLLGALGGMPSNNQSTPGMLNLTPAQARGAMSGFQGGVLDAAKEQQRNNYNLKLNQSAQQAWNAASTPSSQPASATAGGFPTSAQNGTALPNNSNSHLGAPPGVPTPPTSFSQQPQSTPNPNITASKTGFGSNGIDTGPSANNHPPNQTSVGPNSAGSNSGSGLHPQTPAQQVLMSAADRWGLLGLLAMIKSTNADMDHGLSSVGTDLATMGLDLQYPGNLYSTFITPWADQSAAHTVEPDFELPACYSLTAAPPGPGKANAFSDETLFFMFYSSPRDALQEVAAQELWNRNWRFHKELRLWITKETGSGPTQKSPLGEVGSYTYWDVENWARERKEMTVLYAELEEKMTPVFANVQTLQLAAPGQQQGQQQQAPGQHHQPTPQAQQAAQQQRVY